MTTKPLQPMLALLLALALQPASAQNKTVFRCEDAAGRVTYSDEACRGGVALANTDERSSEQRRAAADVARREERLADRLARERRAEQKAARPAGAAHIPHAAAENSARLKSPDMKDAKATPRKKKSKAPKAAQV